ncbi:MAG: hypothetical protein LBT59_11000, partial [Clostridiales bacterium]|nr:hypothetical protein [Clostridiales bacterium]
MTASRAKSIAIAFLCALAVILTAQLWLGNLSVRNSLYAYFLLQRQSSDSDESWLISMPYRLLANHGGNVFEATYSGLKDNPIMKSVLSAAGEALKTQDSAKSYSLDYNAVYNEKSYICDYSFRMSIELFAIGLNAKTGELGNRMPHFDFICVIPRGNTAIVMFVDEINRAVSEFTVKVELPVPSGSPSLIYESSKLKGLEVFSSNVFIPRSKDGLYEYPALLVTNPYMGSDLLIGTIERKVDSFFVNPAAKLYFIGENNIYTFIDESTVVKYFQNDVLDYANYKSSKINSTFMQDYAAALRFLRNDKQVANEFYLADCQESDTDVTFYFDYVVNNLPVIVPDDYKREGDATLRHAIEITVSGENVSHY